MIIKYLLNITISIIFYTNFLIAEDICDNFLEDLKNQTNDLELYEPSKIQFYTYGFDVKRTIKGMEMYVETNKKFDQYEELHKFFSGKISDVNESKKIDFHPTGFGRGEYDDRFYHEQIQISDNKFCEKYNCHQNLKNFLNDNDYLTIDRVLLDSMSTDYHDNWISKFNNDNFLPGSNWVKWSSPFFLEANTNFITHIDDKPINEYSNQELIEIFYLIEETDVRKFRIYSINTENFESKGLWDIEGHIDINITPMLSYYRPVNLLFKFGSFLNIETVDNEISFDYALQSTWEEPKMNDIAKNISDNFMNGGGFYCSLNLREYNDEDLIIFWPDFRVHNFKELKLKNEDIEIKFTYYADGSDVLGTVSHKSSVTLHRNLKLNNFPFDKQKFNFKISDENIDVSQIYILSDLNTIIDLNSYESLDREWSIVSKDLYQEEIISTFDNYYIPSFTFNIVLERNPSYYIFKVVLPILILLLVLYCSILIPPKQLESKLTLTVVCFLALIAYIFVVDESVPKLSYMTLMDYFILVSFIFAAIPNIYAIYEFNHFQKYQTQNRYAKRIALLMPTTYLFCVFIILVFNVNSFKLSASSLLNLFKF